jgi:hypothetical protein
MHESCQFAYNPVEYPFSLTGLKPTSCRKEPPARRKTMSSLKVAALAVAITGGMLSLAPVEAQAQGWGRHNSYDYGYNHGYGHAPQPQYVHPKILRKQAQLQARFYQKYGHVQPQQHYGYGRPQHRDYHHQPRGYGHGNFYAW